MRIVYTIIVSLFVRFQMVSLESTDKLLYIQTTERSTHRKKRIAVTDLYSGGIIP